MCLHDAENFGLVRMMHNHAAGTSVSTAVCNCFTEMRLTSYLCEHINGSIMMAWWEGARPDGKGHGLVGRGMA